MKRVHWRIQISVAFSSAIAIMMIAGCTQNEEGRLAIQGTIEIGDQPIDHATLVLTPTSAGGSTVTTRIESGHFSFTRETGPRAGEYTVRINPDEASIEAIVEVAKRDPNQAAREFRAQPMSSSRRPFEAGANAMINITDNEATPLSIELRGSK